MTPADGGVGLDRHEHGPIRLLIADDQDLVLAGLTTILGSQPHIEVVAQARDGRQAVDLARQLRPDVCLVDIRMPRLDGIEVTRQLAGTDVDSPIPVVVITTFDLDEYVYSALKAGARGFLLKDAGPSMLVAAVEAAASGNALIAPSITARLLTKFARRTVERPNPPREPLSARETEVLVAVSKGRTNAEIARDLYVSVSTVKSHIASLMAKLSARNRVELAIYCFEANLAADADSTDADSTDADSTDADSTGGD